MDKVSLYRQYIQELLSERAKLRCSSGAATLTPNDPIESETIFDTTSDRYQLVNVGWKNSSTRIYGCVLHVDIKDGKIWVQHDGTEDAIAQSADA